MGKGGDTTTTSTSGELPSYIKPYVTDMLTRAQGVANTPYQPYGNPRLTDFSDDTQTAFDMVRDQTGAGHPEMQTAFDSAGGIANHDFRATPSMRTQAYMNPYITNVLDVQKGRADRAFQEQQSARDASAVAAGAFGGNRRFVTDSLAQRDFNEQMQNIDAQGLSAAFDRATGLFQSDEDRRMATADLQLDAGRQIGALSELQQDMGFKDAAQLSEVGSRIQQRDQANLDMGYQDFINQRDYPAEQLSLYSQLLSGTPITANSTTTTTEPAPSWLSQLAGGVTAGAGIWNLFN